MDAWRGRDIASVVGCALCLAGAPAVAAGQRLPSSSAANSSTGDRVPHGQVVESLARLPLHFEENGGQAPPSAGFVARGTGYVVWLSASDVQVALRRATPGDAGARDPHGDVVRMRLVGASPHARGRGLDPLPGRVNIYRGSDPSRWRSGLQTFAQVRYEEVYPGIDLVYQGNQLQLQYDFVVAAGADPGRIALGFDGADRVELDAEGNLLLRVGERTLDQLKPFTYQELDGRRQEVASRFVRDRDGRVRFQIGEYDRSRELVIDPTLRYSTYFGGVSEEGILDIALDRDLNILVTGYSADANGFPTTAGALKTTRAGQGAGDAFVSKFNPTGTTLIFSTLLGGAGEENFEVSQLVGGVATDPSGNVHVTGTTKSIDFPTTQNAFDATFNNDPATNPGANAGTDAFYVKLSPTGALLYATYLGGRSIEVGTAIAADDAGNAYVAGVTNSSQSTVSPGSGFFPVTNDALDPVIGGSNDAFLAKFSASGSLTYCTYIGGNSTEVFYTVDIKASRSTPGVVYMAGDTSSNAGFPVTPATAVQPVYGGGVYDGFLLELDTTQPAGEGLLYGTYFGGIHDEQIFALALDGAEHVYVTGATTSTDAAFLNRVPLWSGGAAAAGRDMLIAKFDTMVAGPGGLIYGMRIGGNNSDDGRDIVVDPDGRAWVAGHSNSSSYPPNNTNFVLKNAFDTYRAGNGARHVLVELNAAGDDVLLSSYAGSAGSGSYYPIAVAANAYGDVFLGGSGIYSNQFPVVKPYQTRYGDCNQPCGGDADAFLQKVLAEVHRRDDFDGDRKADLAVYRPSTGTWFSLASALGNASFVSRGWGIQAQGDVPVRGDFDGDGIADPTVYRPAFGTWFILKSSADYTQDLAVGWGVATDTLVPADYDGDGTTDVAVFRPSEGRWYVRPSSSPGNAWNKVFGATGDTPVPGDYDGDGKTDLAVYRPVSGTWFILKSSTNNTEYYWRGWGIDASGDRPAPGDYDGDRKTDVTVYRPGTGTWFILRSSSGDTTYAADGWGNATDTLVPADYDGDRKTDLAIYRSSSGEWYVKPSGGATSWSLVFGEAGDVPLQKHP